MSVRSTLTAVSPTRVFSNPRDLRILRYAVGSTIAMAVAMGFAWNLSFLVPVLALSFLANPAARPNLRGSVAFVAMIAVACLAGLTLGRYLIPYPLVYLPFAGLLLFRLFYAQWSGTSPMLITWLLIALLVIPLIMMLSPPLALLVAAGIVFGAFVTVAVVLLAYALLPETSTADAAGAPSAAKTIPPMKERFRSAALSTMVVWPVMTLFYMFEWAGGLLILIFIALLSQQPGFAKNFKMGKALIIGNIIGGAAAIAFYELLVMMPEFGFLLMLTLLSGLIFGARVFSGKPAAPLYGMAFSTVLLVIGSTTTSTGDAGSKVYERVIQMMIAVSYVVTVFALVEHIQRRRGN